MLIQKPSDLKGSDITPESVYVNRRQLLKQALAMGAVPALAGLSPMALAEEKSNTWPNLSRTWDVPDETLTPESVATSYNNFYELGTGKKDPKRNADQLITADWKVKVTGECDKPGEYLLEDILKPHTLEERIYRLRCVEAWSMVVPWVGFPLGDLLKRFAPNSKAKYVQFVTILDPKNLKGQRQAVLDWPYVEGLRIDEAMHPLSLMAVGMYGKTLPNQNGAPLRLVVPWKYGFKSIKSIVEIRFTEKEPKTSWNASAPHEYGFYSNVNPDVSHPRWSQAKERRLDKEVSGFSALLQGKIPTLPFNGYAEEVAGLYAGMDLKRFF